MEVIDVKASGKIEDIIKMKNALESKDDGEEIQTVLKRLSELDVTYEDLSSTKIGITLKKLTKHKDRAVVKLAEELMNKWKKLVKKCDKGASKDNGDKEKVGKPAVLNPNFKEHNKKILDSLNDPMYLPFRNGVKRLIYDALLNNEQLERILIIYIQNLNLIS